MQIVEELELEKYKSRVSLFSRDIRRATSLSFWKFINDNYGTWANEFAAKRDPVAHGLPIYMIPKFFENADQRELADKLDSDSIDAVLKNEFELADDLRLRSQKLGTFVPLFSSDPSEKLMPLYPVVSIDISKLVRIIEIIEDTIKN